MTKLLVKLFVKDREQVENQKVRQRYGVLSGFVGIFCNLLLFAFKFLIGTFSNSIAITADAFNNLSDAGSSAVTVVGFKMAGRPADEEHPFGHGRIEYISGLIVSLVILLMGLELFRSSVTKIIHPEEVSASWISAGILAFSILLKLWMGLFNRKIGKTIASSTLQAAAMDSLSDVISTATVLLSLGVFVLTGFSLDGYIGALVAVFIMYTGVMTARDTLSPLLGQAPDPEFVHSIEKRVLAHSEVVGIHDLIVHNYGPGRSVISLHAEVPCNIDILQIHDTIDLIERELKECFQCEAVIHMDPIATDDEKVNEMHRKIAGLVKTIDTNLTIHDFRMVEGKTHTNLIFDVVVPHHFFLSDEEVRREISARVKRMDSCFETVLTVDKSYI